MIPKYQAWDTKRKVMYLPEELAKDGMTLSADGRGFVNVSGTATKFDEYYEHLLPLQSTGLKDNTKWKQLTEDEQCQWLGLGKTAMVMGPDEDIARPVDDEPVVAIVCESCSLEDCLVAYIYEQAGRV